MLSLKKYQLNSKNILKYIHSIKIETRQGITASDVRQTIKDLGIDLKKGEEIIDGQSNRQILYTMLDSDKYYAIVSIVATDASSAVLAAINNLNNLLSIATFYNIVSPWLANSPQITVFNSMSGTAEPLRITDIFRTYDYIDSSNNVFEDTKNIINNPLKVDIVNKLHSAFSYTNLSRASLFQETKYISLWIALESIMRTGQYTDIISHVKKVLPATLCTRYFYKIIRNFAEDVLDVGSSALIFP